MFPVWFDFFSVYLHYPFTASIIFDSLLEYLNGTTILIVLLPSFKNILCLDKA